MKGIKKIVGTAHTAAQPLELDPHAAKLKSTLLNDIKRSAYVYRVDCGGCNACEIEIFAATTPVFDTERFGIKVVASPRHADILLFTGAVTRPMRMPALRAYEAAPDPKIVVSYGACGCDGGIFHDLYGVWGGTDKIIPVDVYIPGCPPTPAATIYGFAMALGLLDQKLKAEVHFEDPTERVTLKHTGIPLELKVLIEREARLLAGYRHGQQIADEFMDLLVSCTPDDVDSKVNQFMVEKNDPRLHEIIESLYRVSLAHMSGQSIGATPNSATKSAEKTKQSESTELVTD
ncbi:NADH-quinone oxidoreductase subunit B family protein [Photobacterium sanguinicancri]|uniref:NADH-quinone oxidoreductase subunit B family protein n=1 Tax=Photobacterium sanguinicancri TaxID=875932 RepID=UPI000789950C|nr:NADH-quinone oxidoreductase subunit B family protein [Photobacterium sanguinicancri]KXI24585.1 hydrogenase [Photobacterium sanguinicancri]MDO6500416.1 NADH-quinone oxidoreductase subunit B family protein [Photobacterium sanguinicancri]